MHFKQMSGVSCRYLLKIVMNNKIDAVIFCEFCDSLVPYLLIVGVSKLEGNNPDSFIGTKAFNQIDNFVILAQYNFKLGLR